MRSLIFILIALNLSNAYAGKKEHRHHEAHVHGTATLNIAFDQLKGKIEFKAASDGVLGFEHEAKSEKDKKKLSEMILFFEKSIGAIVKLEDSLSCAFSKEKIENVIDGKHANFIATYNVDCKKDPTGSKLTLDFTTIKGLTDIDVTILLGDLQKTVEVKKKPLTIELK